MVELYSLWSFSPFNQLLKYSCWCCKLKRKTRERQVFNCPILLFPPVNYPLPTDFLLLEKSYVYPKMFSIMTKIRFTRSPLVTSGEWGPASGGIFTKKTSQERKTKLFFPYQSSTQTAIPKRALNKTKLITWNKNNRSWRSFLKSLWTLVKAHMTLTQLISVG